MPGATFAPVQYDAAMCYSAQLHEAYLDFCRAWGAALSLPEFARQYGVRQTDRRVRIPRAVDRWFAPPQSDGMRAVAASIEAFDDAETTRLESELFSAKTRLNTATRALAVKPTKKAAEDRRIATNKIEAAKTRLADLRRNDVLPRDRRFFPGWTVPVVIAEADGLKIVPMRYQCRLAGKPATYDARYPGTYNARRDNLEGFWKGQFGHTHGVIVADVFFENVAAPDGSNRVLRFAPRDGSPLFIACLWSRWTDPQGTSPDLLSFAAVTDAPEPEVAAAGHDRTVVNLRPENVASWLHPDPRNLAAMYALMDDKQHPHYEFREAA